MKAKIKIIAGDDIASTVATFKDKLLFLKANKEIPPVSLLENIGLL